MLVNTNEMSSNIGSSNNNECIVKVMIATGKEFTNFWGVSGG